MRGGTLIREGYGSPRRIDSIFQAHVETRAQEEAMERLDGRGIAITR